MTTERRFHAGSPSDPGRLLDGGSDFEVELLRSAIGDGPSRHSRKRTMIALGLGTGIVGAGVTAATSTAASTGGILKWIGIGVVSGGLVVGGAQQAVHMGAPPHLEIAVKGPVAHEAHRVALAPNRPWMKRSVETPIESPPPSEVADAEPEKPAVLAPIAPIASKKNGPSLSDEVKELDRARAALNSGDASRAIEALDQHDKQFGTALLGPEAMVLRIEALSARGDKNGAAALANQFLAVYPHSAYASRVRSLLATSVNGTP
jgi:hypothetical protein